MNVPETEDEMNPYITHELVKTHQHELTAEADHARLVREARLASHGSGIPARQPRIWLRDAAGGLAARLMNITGAHARGY